eukprot:scaffold14356_cov90-Isochrysis_galbana.AAC.1
MSRLTHLRAIFGWPSSAVWELVYEGIDVRLFGEEELLKRHARLTRQRTDKHDTDSTQHAGSGHAVASPAVRKE